MFDPVDGYEGEAYDVDDEGWEDVVEVFPVVVCGYFDLHDHECYYYGYEAVAEA